jgi:hypothetical protein
MKEKKNKQKPNRYYTHSSSCLVSLEFVICKKGRERESKARHKQQRNTHTKQKVKKENERKKTEKNRAHVF